MAKQEMKPVKKTGTKGKKKISRTVPNGVAHVKATFNNTIISVTDPSGNVISWASAGRVNFTGSRKSSAFAATVAAKKAAEQATTEQAEAVERERLRGIREQAEREAERKILSDNQAEAIRQRQDDKDHRRKVNQGALAALVENNFAVDQAKAFITVVFQHKIPGIRMVY